MLHPVQVQVNGGPRQQLLVEQEQFQQPKLQGRRTRGRFGFPGGFGGCTLRVVRRANFFELGADRIGGGADFLGGLLGVGVDEDRTAGLVNRLAHQSDNLLAAAVGLEVVLRAQELQVETMELVGLDQQLHERVAAELFNVAVGVIGRRNGSDTEGDTRSQQIIKSAGSSALPRRIAVKAEYDVVGIAAQDPGVGGRERRPLRRHGIAHSPRMACDGIQLSLTDHGELQIEYGSLGLVECKQNFAFRENRRLG